MTMNQGAHGTVHGHHPAPGTIDLLRENIQAPRFDSWFANYEAEESERLQRARVAVYLGESDVVDRG